MSKDGRIWLSHTGLENLERCPRCFWLRYKRKIYQPEGIVSRLPVRFDAVLKNYFDIYREKDELPPLVRKKLEGKLQNPFKETYFATINESYGFYGKLDEMLVTEKGELVPVDFKTASSDPREKETLPAYQSQIDDYIFLLKQNKKKTADHGYLIYFFPDTGRELHKGFPMIMHIKKIKGNPSETAQRISRAISVLDSPIPLQSKECPFCSWRETLKEEIDD